MIEQIQEQIKCSICVQDFDVPVTIHCGHTFCKQCLRKSPNRQCPLCRKPIISIVENMQQNKTISEIVDFINNGKKKQTQVLGEEAEQNIHGSVQEIHMTEIPFFETNNRSLLLPFTKTRLIIKSNTLTMPRNVRNIVIKQNNSNRNYSTFGNLSNITPSVHVHFEFQAIFQGVNFFKIQSQKQDQEQKRCEGILIKQKTGIRMKQFKQFFDIYDKLNEDYKISIAEIVDIQIFSYRSNNLAVMYGIYRLMDISDSEKIDLLESFKDETRLERLKKYFENVSMEVVLRNPSAIFKFHVPGNSSSTYIFALIIAMFVLWKYGNLVIDV